MIVPDTSVLVSGFTAAHPFYAVAEPALMEVREEGGLAAHTMAEAYSVLSDEKLTLTRALKLQAKAAPASNSQARVNGR